MSVNINKKLRSSRAFTLIEALVAISILMIAIASPMTLAQKGLSTATLSKDQMIASFLVQDAIELVKNIRDKRAVSATGVDWLVGSDLDKCLCTGGDICNFDLPLPNGFKFCTIDTDGAVQTGDVNNAKLKISYTTADITTGLKKFLKYDYLGTNCSEPQYGCNSKFSRYINIKKTSNPDEAVVSARVQWDSPQGIQVIDVQDFIYNYSENL